MTENNSVIENPQAPEPIAPATPPGDEKVIRLPFHQLTPSPTNPRKTRDAQADADLANSIKDNFSRGGPGILEPLLCRPIEGENKFEVVAGFRRLQGAKKAGLDDVPCIVRPMTDAEALEVQIVENLQRKDVEPIEEARGLKFLSESMSVEKIAKRIGKSPSYVYQALKLCDLIPAAQKAMETQGLSAGHAIQIARLTPESQKQALDACYPSWDRQKERPNISVRDLGKFVKDNATIPLNKATFATADPKLIPGVPVCRECPKRAGNNPAFKDLPADSCTDRACFLKKTEAGIQFEIKTAAAEKRTLYQLKDEYRDKAPAADATVFYSGQYKTAGKTPHYDYKTCKSSRPGIHLEGSDRGQTSLICIDRNCRIHWPAHRANENPDAKKAKLAELIEARARGYALDAAFKGKPALTGQAVTRVIFESIHQELGFALKSASLKAMKGKTIDRIRPLLTGELKPTKAPQELLITATLALIGMFAGVSGLHPEKFKKKAAAEIAAETTRPKPRPAKKASAKAPAKAKAKPSPKKPATRKAAKKAR